MTEIGWVLDDGLTSRQRECEEVGHQPRFRYETDGDDEPIDVFCGYCDVPLHLGEYWP